MANRRRRFKLSAPPASAPRQNSYLIRASEHAPPVPVSPFTFLDALQLRRITSKAHKKSRQVVGTPTERIKVQVNMTEQGLALVRFFAVQGRPGPFIRTSWSGIKRASIYFIR